VGNDEFDLKVNNTYSVIHSNFREYLEIAEHDYKHVLDQLDTAEAESLGEVSSQLASSSLFRNAGLNTRIVNPSEMLIGELHEGTDVDENLVNIYSAMMRQKQVCHVYLLVYFIYFIYLFIYFILFYFILFYLPFRSS
jgi:hypothetical protein